MSTDETFKLNPADERCALANAYVPEQIPSMMATISHAEPFLIEDYLGFAKDDWVIFVGYPLKAQFEADHCSKLVAHILDLHRPDYLWFIGPEIPESIAKSCRVRQSDQYLRLDLAEGAINASLQREVNQAARTLTVERTRTFTREHELLVKELMRREKLPTMIAELYRAMPGYVSQCKTAQVLNARDTNGKLTAFFVVELAAEQFDTYMLGCYSMKNYSPHASDLLFSEMISFARERGKPIINLGLGVNEGIRRFKMKWGGKPYLSYEFCECYFGPPSPVSLFDRL
jgi:hypothetical protein